MVLRHMIMREASKARTPQHYYAPLKDEERICLKKLAAYRTGARNPYTTREYPLSRAAAVLVALFVGRWGDLYVLLSRRADGLKSYAGDTALPGGKREPRDNSPEDTARREAFEEIGLPSDRRRIPLLCTLEPFLSTNNLIVFPVVVLVTDPTIKPILNGPEVAALFSHPLMSLLSSTPPFTMEQRSLLSSASDGTSVPTEKSPSASTSIALSTYHTFNDITWGQDGTHVRIHKFLTGREPDIKPLFGLTAAILLRVASIGYGADCPPEFDIEAPDQPPMKDRINYAMRNIPVLIDACKKEKIRVRDRKARIDDGSRRPSTKGAALAPIKAKL